MKKTSKTFTMHEIHRLKSMDFGQRVNIKTSMAEASYFIPVDEQLVSIDGMQFTIIDTGFPHKALLQAEKQIRQQRDVVGAILLAGPERCPNCFRTEEEVGFYLDGGEDPHQLICNACNATWHTYNWHDPKKYGVK